MIARRLRVLRSSADVWLVAGLFALGAIVGSAYVRAFDASGRRTAVDFGQYEFAAAVTFACGHGFVDVSTSDSPALADFLSLKTDRISCADLPTPLPARPPDFTQRLYRYLLTTVALIWAIRGVSWPALWPLFGLSYGVTVAIVYGIVRLAVGRIGSTIAALAVLVSAIHLGQLPFFRDYAKAPFILALILLIAYVARAAGDRRAMLAWSGVFGALLGLGFGFRNDIPIVVPAFVVALFGWAYPKDVRSAAHRFACLALAAVTFLAVAWPIVSAYQRGSNTAHVAFLGLMSTFEYPLGLNGSVYEWGYLYLDRFVDTVVTSHTWRTSGRALVYLSADYDRETLTYVLQIARHWPADIIARAVAAALKVMEFPFTAGAYMDATPVAIGSRMVLGWYETQHRLLGVLAGSGLIFVASALLIVSTDSVLHACLLLIGLIYFAGYPAIQFQIRHFFHLEFLAWWAVVFVAERAIGGIIAAVRANRAGTAWRLRPQPLLRALSFAAVTCAIVFVPLTIARAYQEPHVRSMIASYAAAPRTPIALDTRRSGERTSFVANSLWDDGDRQARVRAAYIVAEFSPACGALRLPVTFRYHATDPSLDYSLDTVLSMSEGDGPTVFFPAYDTGPDSRFTGIDLPRGFESCLARVTRVSDLSPFPLLLNLTLSSGWENAPLYQTLAQWERSRRFDTPEQRVETVPRSLAVRKSIVTAEGDSPPMTVRVPIVHDNPGGGWTIRGRPEGPRASVIQFAAEQRGAGDRFVVVGEVVRGGLTIGLLQGQSWAGEKNVTVKTPGAFAVVLAPEDTGAYGVLLTNALDSWLLRYAGDRFLRIVGWFHTFTDVRIFKAGWAR